MSHKQADNGDELPPGVLQVGPKSISDFKIWVAEKVMGDMNDDER